MAKSKKQKPVAIVEEYDPKGFLQQVMLTLTDGTTFTYSGPGYIREGDARKIIGITFTKPEPMPSDARWGQIQNDENKS